MRYLLRLVAYITVMLPLHSWTQNTDVHLKTEDYSQASVQTPNAPVGKTDTKKDQKSELDQLKALTQQLENSVNDDNSQASRQKLEDLKRLEKNLIDRNKHLEELARQQ